MHTNMALRIHSYSRNANYHATMEYHRDGSWTDMSERIMTGSGSQWMPISIQKSYRQLDTCSLSLRNEDGLLTPENETSAYNLNGASAYDPLIDASRKVRIKQGIYCYAELSEDGTASAGTAPSGGTTDLLNDGLFGDVTDPTDAGWVHWGAVASGADLVLKIDLGDQLFARHGVISFLSNAGASPQIELPASVLFEYSTDDSTYYPIGEAFDMTEYDNSQTGQNFLAYFTDCDKTCRYIRATITNTAEENEIYIDEFAVYGGTASTFQGVYTITGYLGDSINVNNNGVIDLQFRDARKKEADNRRCELTRLYKNLRPEQIIFDLLTSNSYWTPQGTSGANLITDPSFELNTGWTYAGGAHRAKKEVRTGNWEAHITNTDEYILQENIAVLPETEYVFEFWHNGETDTGIHAELIPDVGSTIREPAVGSTTGVGTWQRIRKTFTTEAGTSTIDIKILCDIQKFNAIEDVSLYKSSDIVTDTYDCPLTATEIDWTYETNLSDFIVTKWQGQQGTILDYINELSELVGWVYDIDGEGVRQFWMPPENQTIADPYMNFFGARQIGPDNFTRTYTDEEVRNFIKIVGYEKGNKEVPREYRQEQSISKYGVRYARITEPLIKSASMSDALAKALLRDFAFAGRGLDADIVGDFDMDRVKYICTFNEPVRQYLTNDELWIVESYSHDMTIAGNGFHRGKLNMKRYYSSAPAIVSNVAGTGAANSIEVTWDANTETNLDGYYVYWSTTPEGGFTKRTKVAINTDTITGLTDGTGYWIYVTAINSTAGESDPSGIIYCKAGVGNSGDEATTWGITNLSAAAYSGWLGSYNIQATWTPSLEYSPVEMNVVLYGPQSVTPPTLANEYATIIATDATETDFFNRHSDRVNLYAGTTYYIKIVITEVIINNISYKFGTPLSSNIASVVWS